MSVQTQQVSIASLLGMNMNASIQTSINVWSGDPEDLPVMAYIEPINPNYVFRRELVRDLLAWREVAKRPVLLFGPTQCGKTSIVEQLSSRLGIPLWKITANDDTELSELFGHYTLGPNGESIWVDGPLTQAARNGGWFLLNEVDRLRPSVAVGLNGVLEASTFALSNKAGGEVVVPKESFRIVCTSNTNMAGDETGVYNTANIHDKSLLERFDMIIRVGYMDPEDEYKLLETVMSAAQDDELKYWFGEEGIKVNDGNGNILEGEYVTRSAFIKGLQSVAEMVRSQSVDGGNNSGAALERTMSTSSLLTWAERSMTFRAGTAMGLSAIHYALERVLTNGCTATTKTAIHEMVVSVFNVKPSLV